VSFDKASHPDRLLLTDVPPKFACWLRTRAEALGVEVIEVDDVAAPLPRLGYHGSSSLPGGAPVSGYLFRADAGVAEGIHH
jgi:hypothetical protein